MTGAGAHSHALSVCLLLPSPQQCSTVDVCASCHGDQPYSSFAQQLVLSGFAAENLPRLLEEVTTSTCSELLLVCGEYPPLATSLLLLSQVADEVYRYVNRRGLHESLLGTAFFPHLVQFLITHRLLSSLLSTIISRGRCAPPLSLVPSMTDYANTGCPRQLSWWKCTITSTKWQPPLAWKVSR